MPNIKKIIGIIFIIIFMFSTNKADAEIDYSKNEEYYQNLCAKKSSYNANKTVCSGYEEYINIKKEESDKKVKSIKEAVENTQGDIQKVLDLIKENESLITVKKEEIEKTKKQITQTKEKITELENDLLDRLALMQEMDSDNFVIDFIMSSVDLNDFLVKMDGVNAINSSNNEVVDDLTDQRKKLTEKETLLVEEEEELVESQELQNQLLKEYRTKEEDLYKQLEEERKNKAAYNEQLDGLNIKDVEEDLNNNPSDNSSGGSNSGNNNSGGGSTSSNSALSNPVTHATVTATAWYYPASFGGGWHPGVDLANSTGTAIKSPGKGVVLMSSSETYGYGNYMVTAHQVGNDTYTFLYGHLSGFANVGSTLSKNQTIAYMGSTGNSTGPHLHLEIIKHTNTSLSEVVSKYKKNYDIYFGLGYSGIGNCSTVCRLKPHEYYGLSYGQVY